jgi:hypothetical protein
MSEEQVESVFAFTLNRTSEADLVNQLGVNPRTDNDYIVREVTRAHRLKSTEALEAALLLAFHFGAPKELAGPLCSMIAEDWHQSHEDTAAILQKLRRPETVGCLYEAARSEFEYLAYDDNYALAVKCVWALRDIGTPEAIEKLQLLTEDPRPAVRESATARLNDLRTAHR